MSGGHFDYGCFRISQFADELEMEIKKNNEKNEWGNVRGYSDETLNILKECHGFIKKAGDLAKEIEWLYSDDTGEEYFRKVADEILEK